jgi:hypothetical protein
LRESGVTHRLVSQIWKNSHVSAPSCIAHPRNWSLFYSFHVAVVPQAMECGDSTVFNHQKLTRIVAGQFVQSSAKTDRRDFSSNPSPASEPFSRSSNSRSLAIFVNMSSPFSSELKDQTKCWDFIEASNG